jgi:malonyl-CoA O-methyltransferase
VEAIDRLGRLLSFHKLAEATGIWSAGVRRVPASEGYALWADSYPARPHNPLMEAEQAVMRPILESVRPACALDVGTGTGRYLEILAAAGARTVIGLDLSMAMLARCSTTAPAVCGNACRLPFADRRFDLVCASLMVGDVQDLAGWVREMARVLVPGGHLVYSDFHPIWRVQRWRRTFTTATGRRFELPYFPHSIDEHLAALNGAALTVKAIREPRAAGRREPVVSVFHAARAGRWVKTVRP